MSTIGFADKNAQRQRLLIESKRAEDSGRHNLKFDNLRRVDVFARPNFLEQRLVRRSIEIQHGKRSATGLISAKLFPSPAADNSSMSV